jgi:hypothetical protein
MDLSREVLSDDEYRRLIPIRRHASHAYRMHLLLVRLGGYVNERRFQ